MAGDENDLLAEFPPMYANKAKSQRIADQGGYPKQQVPKTNNNQAHVEDEAETIDEQLINEIEDYLKGVMENNFEKTVEMSDTPIGSSGAKCVAAAVTFCEGLVEMKLSNCDIKDSGAIALFDEIAQSKSI